MLLYSVFFFFGVWFVGRVGTVIDHVNPVGGNLVALPDVIAAELGDRGHTCGVAGEFREIAVVVAAHYGRYELGMVQEVEVMDDVDDWDVEPRGNPTVGGEEKVRLYLFELQRNAPFEKEIPEVGVARLRMGHEGRDVVAEHEGFIVFAVEKEVKLVFGMCFCDAGKGLARELPDAFQSVFQQQTCVDSNFHNGAGGFRPD